MQRLTALLHTAQKEATKQQSKVHQNGRLTPPAGQKRIETNSGNEAPKSHLTLNEQYYADDLSLRDSFDNDRIRLLRIDPGEHLSPVSCHFLISSLQENQKYDALSYCWGTQSQLGTINVNQIPGFYVTKHVLQALRRLRYRDRIRVVWIDAICINQSNVLERNNQVRMMREIYSQAREVVIWLGELDDSQPSCERHLSAFDRDNEVCAEPGLSAVEHGDVGRVLREKLTADSSESFSESSLGSVWWKRIWVLQEFAVSRSLPTVYIGPHAVRWQFFADLLWGKGHHPFIGLRSERRSSLYGLLSTTYNNFYSTDPRDKIYALLGLVDQSQDITVTPDYTKPISEVYEETIHYAIHAEHTLDVLIDKRTRRNLGYVATWVPDLSKEKPREDTVTLDSFQASGRSHPQVYLEQQKPADQAEPHCECLTTRVLRVRGMHFDIVRHCMGRIDCIKYHWIMQSAKVNWEPILDILLSPTMCDPPPTSDPRSRLDRTTSIAYLILKYIWEDARSIVTILDHETRIGFNPIARRKEKLSSLQPGKFQKFIAMLEAYTRKRGMKLTKALKVDVEIAARSEHDLLRKLVGSSYEGPQGISDAKLPTQMRDDTFFSTEYGFVGLGPRDLQVGDSIVTLFGASRPFVLRNHGTHNVLVGDTVVPGIMSGQMMVLYEDGSLQAEDFLLK